MHLCRLLILAIAMFASHSVNPLTFANSQIYSQSATNHVDWGHKFQLVNPLVKRSFTWYVQGTHNEGPKLSTNRNL